MIIYVTPIKQPRIIIQACAKTIIVANQMPSHECMFLFTEAGHVEVVCLWNKMASHRHQHHLYLRAGNAADGI